jgi:hypothetical protein
LTTNIEPNKRGIFSFIQKNESPRADSRMSDAGKHLTTSGRSGKFLKTIAWAGLLAGTLDGAAAVLQYVISGGQDPMRIFMYIASGVFGREAFLRGAVMAWWGIFFHYTIAFSWTTLFFFVYPRLTLLSRNRFISGLAYGVFVWLAMNLIVLPLSNVPPLHFDIVKALLGTVILMLCVGLPISLITSKYYRADMTPEK